MGNVPSEACRCRICREVAARRHGRAQPRHEIEVGPFAAFCAVIALGIVAGTQTAGWATPVVWVVAWGLWLLWLLRVDRRRRRTAQRATRAARVADLEIEQLGVRRVENTDTRWEWHEVTTLAGVRRWVKGRCLHVDPVLVVAGGEEVARLCMTCNAQLPAECDVPVTIETFGRPLGPMGYVQAFADLRSDEAGAVEAEDGPREECPVSWWNAPDDRPATPQPPPPTSEGKGS